MEEEEGWTHEVEAVVREAELQAKGDADHPGRLDNVSPVLSGRVVEVAKACGGACALGHQPLADKVGASSESAEEQVNRGREEREVKVPVSVAGFPDRTIGEKGASVSRLESLAATARSPTC